MTSFVWSSWLGVAICNANLAAPNVLAVLTLRRKFVWFLIAASEANFATGFVPIVDASEPRLRYPYAKGKTFAAFVFFNIMDTLELSIY